MMREVFARRFARAQEEDPDRDAADWPDLVLIDGGRGQLNAAKGVLEDLGIEDVCLVGVAKGPHHGRDGREVFHLMDGRELTLPVNSPVLFYLQRLRDEVHRFAIGAHRAKRAKAIGASPLDEVPGIGPARKKALLMHFGTARAVRGASLEDLQTGARRVGGGGAAGVRLLPRPVIPLSVDGTGGDCTAVWHLRRVLIASSRNTVGASSMAREMMVGGGGQGWRFAGWGLVGLALAMPLVAMQFTRDVAWTASDFLLLALLLGGAGLAVEAAARRSDDRVYRAAVTVALLGSAMLVVINGAVGIIGSEQNNANFAFGGVLMVGLIGTIVARARAAGMRRVMAAMAVAQILVPVGLYAAIPGLRSAIVTPQLAGLTLGFVAVWLASAWLFRKAR